MKANQTFKQADEAVSPVIGVILMVAITVVLAAVVFVLVGNLGGDSETAPTIGWTSSESADTLTVNKAPTNDVAWNTLQIAASSNETTSAAKYSVNGGGNVALIGTATDISVSTNIGPGNVLAFCSTGAETLTITITHPGSGSIIRTETFNVPAAAGCT